MADFAMIVVQLVPRLLRVARRRALSEPRQGVLRRGRMRRLAPARAGGSLRGATAIRGVCRGMMAGMGARRVRRGMTAARMTSTRMTSTRMSAAGMSAAVELWSTTTAAAMKSAAAPAPMTAATTTMSEDRRAVGKERESKNRVRHRKVFQHRTTPE